jgi:hypothetical protein
MRAALSVSDRQRALQAFTRGLLALERAEQGDATAVDEAIHHLDICLEGVTAQTWPCLWVEAQIARADAYALRRCGDPLENARIAFACIRAALCATLEDVWQRAAEPLPCDDRAGCEEAGEP